LSRPQEQVERSVRWAGVAGLAMAGVVTALSYRESSLVADSAYLMVAASHVLVDGVLPVAGPSLYGTFVSNPIWYYVVALLFGVMPSITAVHIAIGALSMTKLLLAWRVGSRIAAPPFACCFAVWMCWPGWSYLEPVVVSHTSLVQASGLLCALAALRARAQATDFRIVLMFAAFVLAIAVHPTNLVITPLLLLPCLRRTWPTRGQVGAYAIGALMLVLASVPSVLHDASAATSAGGSFLARLPEPGWLMRWPGVIYALMIDAQGSMLQQIAMDSPMLSRVLGIAYMGLLAFAGIGLLGTTREYRAPLAVALLALIAWCGALAISRPTTPAWMLYSVQPLSYAIWAFGFVALLKRLPARGSRLTVFGLLLIASVAAAFAFAHSRAQRASAGFERQASARVADVTRAPKLAGVNAPHLPPRAVDALGSMVCTAMPRLALFGELAVLAEASQGTTLKLEHCPPERWPSLGPAPKARNTAGVPLGVARELGLAGVAWSNLMLVEVERVIAPVSGHVLEYNTRYPPYAAAELSVQPIEIDTLLHADEFLVFTSLLNGFAAPEAAISVDGVPLAALADTGTSRFFACPAARACRVQGTVVAGARRYLQVFVLMRPA